MDNPSSIDATIIDDTIFDARIIDATMPNNETDVISSSSTLVSRNVAKTYTKRVNYSNSIKSPDSSPKINSQSNSSNDVLITENAINRNHKDSRTNQTDATNMSRQFSEKSSGYLSEQLADGVSDQLSDTLSDDVSDQFSDKHSYELSDQFVSRSSSSPRNLQQTSNPPTLERTFPTHQSKSSLFNNLARNKKTSPTNFVEEATRKIDDFVEESQSLPLVGPVQNNLRGPIESYSNFLSSSPNLAIGNPASSTGNFGSPSPRSYRSTPATVKPATTESETSVTPTVLPPTNVNESPTPSYKRKQVSEF